MSFPLDFSDQATEDINYHKKAGNKALLKKMLVWKKYPSIRLQEQENRKL
jgi:hypothetical protein